MVYLIQVNLYTAIMLLVYMLLLRNRPMYGFSRAYLLAAGVLPLVLPFVKLPEIVQERVQAVSMLRLMLPEVIVGDKGSAGGVDVGMMAWVVYALVSGSLMVYHVWNLYRLQRVVRSNAKEARDGYVLIANSGYGPGSFGRYIFFPGDELNEAILAHERAHITLGHTGDILFLNLLQAVAWPSLLLGRIKKEIKEVHEFQADAMANEDKRSYAELLISSVLNTRSLPEMHLFIIHPLKRRIMMLQKNGSGSPLKRGLLVSSIVLVLGCAVMFVQGCSKNEAKKDDAKTETTKKVRYGIPNDMMVVDSVKKVADVMPDFKGDLVTFLSQNIHYPEYAKKNNIEGRVMVKFIVAKDGSVINPQIVKSPDSSVSRAALDVMNKMPKWEAAKMADGRKVNVEMYLPILFKLK